MAERAPGLPRWLKPALFAAASLPAAALAWDALHDGLGANPVEEITHRTGDWALRFLLVTLCVTPLRRLTGWNQAVRLRRMLGLFAFFYASLHFLTYAIFDAALDLGYVLEDVLERPYITVGFSTFLLLVPLAATSTNAMVQRLGGRRWQRLHQLIYVAVCGGALHFLWLVKADTREPLVYFAIVAGLLALRLPGPAAALGRARARLPRLSPRTS